MKSMIFYLEFDFIAMYLFCHVFMQIMIASSKCFRSHNFVLFYGGFYLMFCLRRWFRLYVHIYIQINRSFSMYKYGFLSNRLVYVCGQMAISLCIYGIRPLMAIKDKGYHVVDDRMK